MSILSWNVNGLSEVKRRDQELVDLICAHDIIFLYETWANSKTNIDISGYKSHNFYRKYQHKRAKRCSGGVAVYYKESLQDGIQIVRNHYDTLIWLKLDKMYFNLKEDAYICGVYVWCEDSPAYNVCDTDLFELLQTDIYEYDSKGKIFIVGDWNARIGNQNDFIVFDDINITCDSDGYEPDVPLCRASFDKRCNAWGYNLLDLCKATGFRVVNGRLNNDRGNYTYISSHGASTIDYLLTKECYFSDIHCFQVHDFNEWSDHSPVAFKLTYNDLVNSQSNSNNEHYSFYKWSPDLKSEFRSKIISKLPELNNLIHTVNTRDRSSIDSVVTGFNEIIQDVTNPLFEKNLNFKKKASFIDKSRIKNKDWFDFDCKQARENYLEALHKFNTYNSNSNRENFCLLKKKYKALVKHKRNAFELKKISQIEKLRFSKPIDFWKYFNSHNKSNPDISIESFFEYFSGLGNDIFQTTNEESESFTNMHDFDNFEYHDDTLNNAITIDEVVVAIKQLKRGKSCGNDCLLNEYFIESSDILAAHICDIFNHILNSGYFPKSWTEGVIVPLHKKGDINTVNNYRGITLVSCLSKLFTSILNKRITEYCNNVSLPSNAQFGFRKERSTIDALFVLMNVVQNYVNDNKRLYCVFVDFKKAFDCIYRNALWLKLFNIGINGKILRILKDMYNKVKSCVKLCNSYSDFFEYSVGLRQGEVLSPILFSLFIDDIESFLRHGNQNGLTINEITLILLLFADDMVILGNSPDEINRSLTLLSDYCTKWGLDVNIDKTKVVVFRKRGRLKHDELFMYKDQRLEIVNNFNYLGTIFNYNGTFALNQQYLIGKANKALNVLLINCKRYQLKPKLLCQLFDAFVGSILNYAAEIWGNSKSKDIERIHLKFCKKILKVHKRSCNAAVYGELARYPLFVSRYIKIVKYWFKILHTDNNILQEIYKLSFVDCNNGKSNWVSSIKCLLCSYGFNNIWEYPDSVDTKLFMPLFKQRIVDCFVQNWRSDMNDSSILNLYRQIKLHFSYESYLDILPHNIRTFLTRIRVSSHTLRVHTGRYSRIDRNERYCLYCDLHDIEDEYHFVVICPLYTDLRKQYLRKYYYVRPSMLKFIEMLMSENKNELFNLSRFIKKAMIKRNFFDIVNT